MYEISPGTLRDICRIEIGKPMIQSRVYLYKRWLCMHVKHFEKKWLILRRQLEIRQVGITIIFQQLSSFSTINYQVNHNESIIIRMYGHQQRPMPSISTICFTFHIEKGKISYACWGS